MKEVFPGVFKDGKNIYTAELNENKKSLWDPAHSKLSAAVINGLKENPVTKGAKILYLGASVGTTVSHVSNIVGSGGIVYAVDFAYRVFNTLMELSRRKGNIAPVFADARKPEKYMWIEEVDVVYVDVAQPDQTEIAIRNCREFLKSAGFLMISIKSQSIDVTKSPKYIYQQEKKKLEDERFDVLELIELDPYEEKHAFIVARKKAAYI